MQPAPPAVRLIAGNDVLDVVPDGTLDVKKGPGRFPDPPPTPVQATYADMKLAVADGRYATMHNRLVSDPVELAVLVAEDGRMPEPCRRAAVADLDRMRGKIAAEIDALGRPPAPPASRPAGRRRS